MRFGSPKASSATTPIAADSQPNPQPSSSSLSFADAASIFVRIRRLNAKNKTKASKSKQHHIVSESGPPQTHPSLAGEGVTSIQTVPVSRSDMFICSGGVDVEKLLKATRQSLYNEAAESAGANVLIEEEWTCVISGPKNRPNGTFRVHITYSAQAARAGRPDPKVPVALDKIKSVEGLMYIEKREPVPR